MTKSILIVEDEALIAMSMQADLEDHGFNAHFAITMPDALSQIESATYDAVVLDYNVGGTTSVALADTLRSRRIPFVVCSGSEPTEGIDAFRDVQSIGKPYRPEELMAALRGALGGAA